MRAKNFNVNELIDGLRGSFDSIADSLPFKMLESDLTKDDLNKIKSEIFHCSECGSWYDVEEKKKNDFGNDICSECFSYRDLSTNQRYKIV